VARPDPQLERFIRTQWHPVVSAVARAVGDRDLAQDAVQDAVERYLGLGADADIENLAAWLTVVARNLARDRQRSRAAEHRAHERWLSGRVTEPSVEQACADLTHELDVRGALALLPSRQRLVCELRYLSGQSVEQIARELGVTTGTVKTQLHRARRRLSMSLAA
jgi:RNA polymerase sigma-70 factor (ECF subfamily)